MGLEQSLRGDAVEEDRADGGMVPQEPTQVVGDRRRDVRIKAADPVGLAQHVPQGDDGEQKRVADRDRQLVAHGGRALGVAEEEEVGHGRESLPAAAALVTSRGAAGARASARWGGQATGRLRESDLPVTLWY